MLYTIISTYKVKEEGKVRENLKKARKEKGLTQQQVADQIGISLRYYKALESGERLGGIEIWDELEDIFKIHQRKLREISTIRHDKADNQ